MRRLAVMVALVVSGCGVDDQLDRMQHPAPSSADGFPAVETLFTVTPEAVECRGTIREDRTDSHVMCQWRNVTYEAAPVCLISLSFDLRDRGWSRTGATYFSSESGCL